MRGEEGKKSEILGGPAEGGLAEGGPEEGGKTLKTQHTQQHTTTHTTTHNNTQQHTHTHRCRFLYRIPSFVLSRCRSFVPHVCFFLSRLSFFIWSRMSVFFVPFAFFCPDNCLLILSRLRFLSRGFFLSRYRPRPPSVQWPCARPHQPPKGSGKGRGRSQPAHQVPIVAATTTRSSPAESEAAAVAKLSKLEVALSALDAKSPEGKYLQSVIDKTRVRAGQGHPGKRLDECQQHMVRAGKRLELPPQLRNRNVCKKSTTSGPSPSHSQWR